MPKRLGLRGYNEWAESFYFGLEAVGHGARNPGFHTVDHAERSRIVVIALSCNPPAGRVEIEFSDRGDGL